MKSFAVHPRELFISIWPVIFFSRAYYCLTFSGYLHSLVIEVRIPSSLKILFHDTAVYNSKRPIPALIEGLE